MEELKRLGLKMEQQIKDSLVFNEKTGFGMIRKMKNWFILKKG